MASEYLKANARRIAELAEKLGIEEQSSCRFPRKIPNIRVSCGGQSFETNPKKKKGKSGNKPDEEFPGRKVRL